MLARTMLSSGTCRLWGKKAMSGTAKGQPPRPKVGGRGFRRAFLDQEVTPSHESIRLEVDLVGSASDFGAETI